MKGLNYIHHLNGFLRKSSADFQLNPSHISLYLALFQQWNLNRFRNPVSIARGEVMRISKINSRVTYHKCMRELHNKGYFHYDPSYNHFRGSLVYMLDFGQPQEPSPSTFPSLQPENFCTGAGQEMEWGCTSTGLELGPSINSVNRENSKNGLNKAVTAHAKGSKNEQGAGRSERKEKGCAQKEKKLTPGLEEVLAFFQAIAAPALEGHRFFHYYSATGWKMGHTPMQDWEAAARKWLLHCRGNVPETGASAPVGMLKNYSEPL